MYKNKKMLSAVAAVAVISSGALAFDTNPSGQIISAFDGCTLDYNANYVGAADENSATVMEDLKISNSLKGDALIYPAFRSDDGWESEIIVRNVKAKAIVAKAVLYREYDSAELLDFNIYLSPHDVARFKIKDGKVTTSDYSIIGHLKDEGVVSDPKDGVANDKNVIAFNQEYFGKEKTVGVLNPELTKVTFKDKNGVEQNASINKGYVVIYGMMETVDDGSKYHTDTKVFAGTDKEAIKKATGHKDLFLDYRKTLDICRDGWRVGFTGNNIKHGMFLNKVHSPSLDASCDDALVDSDFTSTSSDALLGTVEISKDGGDPRSLLLPATALENYTVNNQMMLWAEGEYAAIQDRRLTVGSGGDKNTPTKYDVAGLQADAKTFLINKAYYTYKEGNSTTESSNTLLLTQPMKRPLVQLGDPDNYWEEDSCHNTGTDRWGYFQFNQKIYDEDEREYAEEAGLLNITSPYTTNKYAEPYREELQPISNLEETGDAKGQYFAVETNGYIDIDIKNTIGAIPAIVTQMTHSKIGGESQINWIYAPADKVK